MSDEIETKLSAARTRLIIDRPFLGALVLRMPMKQGDPRWCKTIGTDARNIYYNPKYIESLTIEQVQFALAHEAMHCALSHFSRRQHRSQHRWDVACDLAINPILIREGMTPPPGALFDIGFENMMAEEIYPLVKDDTEEETHDDHLYNDQQKSSGDDTGKYSSADGERDSEGNGADTASVDTSQPLRPLSEMEKEQLSVQWGQRLAGAAQQAMQSGKLSRALRRLVDHLLQPQLPWRMLLARYMNMAGCDDYSYMRPSRREGDAIFPSLRSAQVDVFVVIDTSGSIKLQEMREFISEVDAIKGQIRARITLHVCDFQLAEQGPWMFEPWEELKLPAHISGGGGTRFTPVFDWINEQGLNPQVLMYFTDAEGEFPPAEPPFPVIWLVKGRRQVPWGQRIQLN